MPISVFKHINFINVVVVSMGGTIHISKKVLEQIIWFKNCNNMIINQTVISLNKNVKK